MRVGVGVGGVGRKKHRSHHRLQLDVDARLLAGLLDDRLRLLPGRINGGLEHELQRFAVLGANAVGALFPAGRLENRVGFLDVEFEFGIFRPETFRIVEEVCRGDTGAAIDEFLDRGAIDQQADCLAHRRVAEQGMPGLAAGALAVHLDRRIGRVQHYELDIAARSDPHSAFAGTFQPLQNFVFHQHVPGIIIFAGLQYRARSRHRIAAALHFQRIEMRPVGDVVVGVALGQHQIARLEIDEKIGAGAHRFQVGRRVA